MSQSFFVGDYFLHSIFFENQFIFYLVILAVFHHFKYCGMVFKSVYIKRGNQYGMVKINWYCHYHCRFFIKN